MKRARSVGDADAVADLESAQRQVRRYYSAVALRAAFAGGKVRRLDKPPLCCPGASRFSPSGATSMATGGAVHKSVPPRSGRKQSRNEGNA